MAPFPILMRPGVQAPETEKWKAFTRRLGGVPAIKHYNDRIYTVSDEHDVMVRSCSVNCGFGDADQCEYVHIGKTRIQACAFDIGHIDGTLAIARNALYNSDIYVFPGYMSEPHIFCRPSPRPGKEWTLIKRGRVSDVIVGTDAIYYLINYETGCAIGTVHSWDQEEICHLDSIKDDARSHKMARNTRGDFIITGITNLAYSWDPRAQTTGLVVPSNIIDYSLSVTIDAYDRIVLGGLGWVSTYDSDGTQIGTKSTMDNGLCTGGSIIAMCLDNQQRLYVVAGGMSNGVVKRINHSFVPDYE